MDVAKSSPLPLPSPTGGDEADGQAGCQGQDRFRRVRARPDVLHRLYHLLSGKVRH